MTESEEKFIRDAVQCLEFPSFITRITHVVGKPLEAGMIRLPGFVKKQLHKITQDALGRAVTMAITSLSPEKPASSFERGVASARLSRIRHGAATALTGAAGGLFGLPSLAFELPVTTTLMLRSIAEIAKNFGEDPSSPELGLECLYVFSLGASPDGTENEQDSGYYASRLAFAQLMREATRFLAGMTAQEIARTIQQKSAPALVRILINIASRFEIVVSEKAVGQLIPGLGAATGALINVAFSEYFNEIAKYHFGLKRLEREHGQDAVNRIYSARLSELGKSGGRRTTH